MDLNPTGLGSLQEERSGHRRTEGQAWRTRRGDGRLHAQEGGLWRDRSRPHPRIPTSRTGRDKSQSEPWGGLWARPGPTGRTGTMPPGTDRGNVPPCSYETCRDPQLHMSHLGGGTEASRAGSLWEEPSKLRADVWATQPASPTRMPRHPLPARLQGTELPRVPGVPPALNLGLSGQGSATAE